MTGKHMTGKQWVDLFIKSLFERKDEANKKECYNSDFLWTEFMVKNVMKKSMGEKTGYQVVCRDQNDRENSGEYLNIDAMFFNNSGYKNPRYRNKVVKEYYDQRILPEVVVEHENEGSGEDKIAHCLWKLLCIRSQLRVLICYHKDIEGIREFLENTIRGGKLAEELTDDLLVVIGDSSKNRDPWKKREDIKNYFKIFKWKNNRLEEFTE